MGFEALRFFNFRNLGDGELSLDAREIFLVGENGQGKTNLLEAVHLLCLGSSFREKREAAFFRDTASAAGLFGRYGDADSGDCSLSLRMEPGRRKELKVDDKILADRRELLSRVLCICFVQQDMDFVAGPPEERRRFFDQTLILSDPSFLDTLRSYRQVLKSRNLCLRENRDDLLDVYDLQLAGLGLAIQARRAELVRDFDAAFSPLFQEITGQEDSVRIRYRPSWDTLQGAEEVSAHLAAHRERDRRLGTTTTGPHRDSCSYLRAGREYVPYASTGQLRLCALSLRVAQARFLAARTGRRPILLLDDVLLELDPQRKRAFIARFPPYEQAFFTFLPDESWQTYRTDATQVLSVEQGTFRR
jgi:DNA replication and repair protein RecF